MVEQTGRVKVAQQELQQPQRAEDTLDREEIDDQTLQTLNFLNEMEQEEKKSSQNEMFSQSGLKVQTFGDLHRQSEAKKNILRMPSLNTIYDQVAFELQELPLGFEEALAVCHEKKQLILKSYKQELYNYLYKDQQQQQDKNIEDFVAFSQQTFHEMYRSRSTITSGEEMKQGATASAAAEAGTTPEGEKPSGKDEKMKEQATNFERMLNASLIQRISEETRFAALSRLQGIIWVKSDRIFEQNFERQKIQMLISQAESSVEQSSSGAENTFNLESLIKNFWRMLEDSFRQDFIVNNVVDLFHQEFEDFPEFFIEHYRQKVGHKLIEQINKFKQDFVTATEEEWIVFIRDQKKQMAFNEKENFICKNTDMQVLKSILGILIVLPIKKYIKHDWNAIEAKIGRIQKAWNISPALRCSWQITTEDLEIRVQRLQTILNGYSEENFQLGVACLHRAMFTLLNGIVNGKHYDSKDRAVIKLLLDTCHEVFQKVLRLKPGVSVSFFLTLFETAFATRTPRDKYDIKQMAKLFGTELLSTLQIETSIQRCNVLCLQRVCPPETKSKHIVICVSGFLQELEDNNDTWQNVVTFFNHAEVFALKWTACNSLDLFDKGVFKGKNNTGVKKFLNVINVFSTGQKQFINAYDQARLSGCLLAIFLLKSNFSDGKAVTLIGFSLGSVVAMHCIRILKYMYRRGFVKAGAILHDVQLWAGAFVIDPKKQHAERMRTAYHCSVINGKFWNLWSAKDYVVRHMQPLMQPGTVSIGVKPIMLDVDSDDDGQKGCRKPENFEVSEEGGNHNHIAGCKDFLPKVPFAY